MHTPKVHVVPARIPALGLLALADQAVVAVQCGRCGQRLPLLVRATGRHPLVQAGLVADGALILDRPKGWRWDGEVWRLTAYHRRQRQASREVARLTGNPRAAARLAQNRYARGEPEDDAPYWQSAAVEGHTLPTRLECASCRAINVIDV